MCEMFTTVYLYLYIIVGNMNCHWACFFLLFCYLLVWFLSFVTETKCIKNYFNAKKTTHSLAHAQIPLNWAFQPTQSINKTSVVSCHSQLSRYFLFVFSLPLSLPNSAFWVATSSSLFQIRLWLFLGCTDKNSLFQCVKKNTINAWCICKLHTMTTTRRWWRCLAANWKCIKLYLYACFVSALVPS